MQTIKWEEIPGYNGRYFVDRNGNVYSKYLKREMKPIDRGNGYLFVRLCKNGKIKNVMIHQLVARSFVKNPNNYTEIDHIDGNKYNNSVTNLRFVSHIENMRNPNTEQKRIDAIKKKQGIPIVAILNGEKQNRYCCMMDAARDLGLSCSHIAMFLKGKVSHVKGYIFEYA